MAGAVHNTPPKSFTLPKRMTREEYWALPEESPRCELIDGVVHMAPAPDLWHQDISRRLFRALDRFVSAVGAGEVYYAPLGLSLPSDTELQPDLMVLESGHPNLACRSKSISHPPLLVVEILSPSNKRHDRKVKFHLYQDFGIPNYWIADPETRSIDAWVLVEGAYQLAGQAAAPEIASFQPFTGLQLELDAIFPKLV